MTIDLSAADSSIFLTVLTQAAQAFRGKATERPTAEAIVAALIQAETATKRSRLTYPFEPLLDNWRLCFVTGTRKVRRRGGIVLGKGFYLPKLAIAQISFSATEAELAVGKGAIANQVEVGPVLMRFTGPAHYLGKKNLLAFDFTHLQIKVLGKTVYSGAVRGGKKKTQDFYSQAVATLPFFAFFLVTPDLIAARGRGGGLALWVKEA